MIEWPWLAKQNETLRPRVRDWLLAVAIVIALGAVVPLFAAFV